MSGANMQGYDVVIGLSREEIQEIVDAAFEMGVPNPSMPGQRLRLACLSEDIPFGIGQALPGTICLTTPRVEIAQEAVSVTLDSELVVAIPALGVECRYPIRFEAGVSMITLPLGGDVIALQVSPRDPSLGEGGCGLLPLVDRTLLLGYAKRLKDVMLPIHLTDVYELVPRATSCLVLQHVWFGRTTSGRDAILIGLRTGAKRRDDEQFDPAALISVASFLRPVSGDDPIADLTAVEIRKGWILECLFEQTLNTAFRAAGFNAEFRYNPNNERVEAEGSPIAVIDDVEVRYIGLDMTAEGKLQLVITVHASGFCYTADVTVTPESRIGICELLDVEGVRNLPADLFPRVEIDPDVDIDDLCIIAGLIFGFLAIDNVILLVVWTASVVALDAVVNAIADNVAAAAEEQINQGMRSFGGLPLPLPDFVEKLLPLSCSFDDLVVAGRFEYLDLAPASAGGARLVENGLAIDLDHGHYGPPGGLPIGVEADLLRRAATFGFEMQSRSTFSHVAQPYESLRLGDLTRLRYAAGQVFVPPQGDVTFAVRTSEGRFAKCRARREEAGIHLEFATYDIPRPTARILEARDPVARAHSRGTRTERGNPAWVAIASEPVDYEWDALYVVRGWDIVWPATYSWTLGRNALAEGMNELTLSGGAVTAEVHSNRVRIRTSRGVSVNETLRVDIVDGDGRSTFAQRGIVFRGGTTRYEVSGRYLDPDLYGLEAIGRLFGPGPAAPFAGRSFDPAPVLPSEELIPPVAPARRPNDMLADALRNGGYRVDEEPR